MPAPQIPYNSEKPIDDRGYFVTSWYTWLQGVYKSIRANIATKLGGTLNINITPVSNVGTGRDDLISYTLDANIMRNNGDFLEVEGWGRIENNTNVKIISIFFGSQVIYTTDLGAPNGGTWSFHIKIVRLTSNTQEIVVQFLSNNIELQQYPALASRAAGIQDLTQQITIKCTGQAINDGDITQNIQIIKLWPND